MSCRGSSTITQYQSANVLITVKPEYLPSFRIKGGGDFCFSYDVTIKNQCDMGLRLLSRRWVISDGENSVRQVEGVGVIGEQPYIVAGGEYHYTSYVDLPTPFGHMQGVYIMEMDDGRNFEATIGVFSLSVPNTLN